MGEGVGRAGRKEYGRGQRIFQSHLLSHSLVIELEYMISIAHDYPRKPRNLLRGRGWEVDTNSLRGPKREGFGEDLQVGAENSRFQLLMRAGSFVPGVSFAPPGARCFSEQPHGFAPWANICPAAPLACR